MTNTKLEKKLKNINKHKIINTFIISNDIYSIFRISNDIYIAYKNYIRKYILNQKFPIKNYYINKYIFVKAVKCIKLFKNQHVKYQIMYKLYIRYNLFYFNCQDFWVFQTFIN